MTVEFEHSGLVG